MDDIATLNLAEVVEYHGAIDVLRALREYAHVVYGDSDKGDEKMLGFVFRVLAEEAV